MPDRVTLPRRWPRPPAVVVGLDSITGLQSARILHARGIPVIGVTGSRRHWGARTRTCVAVVESPTSGDALVATLRALPLHERAVLVPCTDGAVATLSRRRGELDDLLLPLAEHDVVDRLMDKERFAEHARLHDLPVPRTRVLRHRADAERAAAELTFPCVLKPSVKAANWLDRTARKGFLVDGPGELLRRYDAVVHWAPVLLAQEWVTGPETDLFSCNAYFGEGGRPLATFVARKVRQWPPQVGTSASGEECREEGVLATTVRLFGGVSFRGLAYLEMKRDSRTGRLVVIEPNVGRPTGRSAIAEAGGVELLTTAYCDALGLPLPRRRTQQYGGAKWIDLRRDLQAAVVARRQGTLTPGEWLRWVRGPKAHAIWSARDPAPFVVDLLHAAGTGARMLAHRAWPRSPRGPAGAPAALAKPTGRGATGSVEGLTP